MIVAWQPSELNLANDRQVDSEVDSIRLDGVDGLCRGLRDAGHEVVLVGALGARALAAVADQEDAEMVIWCGRETEEDTADGRAWVSGGDVPVLLRAALDRAERTRRTH